MKIIMKYRGDKIEISPSNTMLKRSPRIPPKKKPKKNLPLTQEFGDEMLLTGREDHKKHGKRHKKKAKSQKSASGSKNGKKKRKK